MFDLRAVWRRATATNDFPVAHGSLCPPHAILELDKQDLVEFRSYALDSRIGVHCSHIIPIRGASCSPASPTFDGVRLCTARPSRKNNSSVIAVIQIKMC